LHLSDLALEIDGDPAFGRVDAVVVDAGVAASHQPGALIELPVLVAVASPPLAGQVARFVFEADRDAVAGEGPELLAEPIAEFPLPLSRQERTDLLAAAEELVAVSPLGVLGVGKDDAIWVAAVQASSASWTFRRAVSSVKGGTIGADIGFLSGSVIPASRGRWQASRARRASAPRPLSAAQATEGSSSGSTTGKSTSTSNALLK
jgi:hypothetical protein